MKNILIKFIAASLIFATFTGCIATHIGGMFGSAELGAPNFIYKKQNVFGVATATYILGIGGVARQSLVLEAKRNMLKENQLLANQALANVSVSYKTTGFLIFVVTIVECVVSADIVEFSSVESGILNLQSQNLASELSNNLDKANLIKTENKAPEVDLSGPIKVGDKVNIVNYFRAPVEGKVLEIQNSEYIIEYATSNNKIKQVKVPAFQVERLKN